MATEEQTFSMERILTDALDMLPSLDDTIQADPATAAAEVAPVVRDALAAAVRKLSDDTEASKLAVYVSNMPMQLVDPEAPPNQLMGWDEASKLPIERLRELFEEDDWGAAWELFDAEQTEWFEQDDGALGAYANVLTLLGVRP